MTVKRRRSATTDTLQQIKAPNNAKLKTKAPLNVMKYKNKKPTEKQRESGKITLALLLTLTALAAASGVWSELKAAKPDSLYMEQQTSVNGQICIGEDGGNYCNVGADGYKFWVQIFSYDNGNSGPAAPEDDAITWVGAQEGYGTPGERNIKTGTAFAATLLRGPDNAYKNTGEATVTVQTLVDGDVTDEHEASLVYALQTRLTAPLTIVNEKGLAEILDQNWNVVGYEPYNEHYTEAWHNGGNARPEALEGTLTMILDGEVFVDEEPMTSGYVQHGHTQHYFPGKIQVEE